MTESEIVRLRAQVDTLTREAEEAAAAFVRTHARNKAEFDRMHADLVAYRARAESAEAERDDLRIQLHTANEDRAAQRARITAVEEVAQRVYDLAAQDPRNEYGRGQVSLARSLSARFRAALREPVGEPQPEPCATCGNERWICDYELGTHDPFRGCIDPSCPHDRRACPACVPPQPKASNDEQA